jgi:hypothetical protein
LADLSEEGLTRSLLPCNEWEFVSEGGECLVVSVGCGLVAKYATKRSGALASRLRSEIDTRSSIALLLGENSVASERLWHVPQEDVDALLARLDAVRPSGRREASLRALPPLPPPLLPPALAPLILQERLDKHLCVEIKPKGGRRMARAPELRRHALSLGRFGASQVLKGERAAAGKQPSWGALGGASSYDPEDLFMACASLDEDRIRTSVAALFAHPQNNLRVSHDGRHVFGWDRCPADATDLPLLARAQEALVRWMRSDSADSGNRTLLRIRALQAWDVLDGAGAEVVLARMAEALGVEEATALRMLDDWSRTTLLLPSAADQHPERFAIHAQQIWRGLLTMLDEGEDRGGDDSCAHLTLAELVRESHALDRRLATEQLRQEDAEAEAAFRRFEARVQRLGASECELLLRCWLVSVAMADCSVMIQMRELDADSARAVVIDIGPKPASKIRSRRRA